MRVTPESQSQQAILNLQLTYARMTKLQSQIATGNQIQVASDNPVGMVQILQNNTLSAQLNSNLTAIQNATTSLQTSVTSLTQVQNLISSVKSTAITANSATNETASNSTLAAQVNSAINQLLGLANTQLPDGSHIFGGTASRTSPFAITGSNGSGEPSQITYQGSQSAAQVIVGKGVNVNTFLPGSSIFQPNISGQTIYSGTTGAQASSVPDSASGQATLQVAHTLTSFGGSSGVAAGVSSASGDTILGPSGANSLVITDSSGTGKFGTVSLNGGTPVAFSNTNTDLKVVGPAGEVVYLDTTAIAAGFNGHVDLTGDGTLSTDGGATTTAIDFSSNQQITNSVTGATTNVNSSNVRIAGNDQLTYPGKVDIFQTLIALRDTINNTQNLNASDRSSQLSQQIAQLDRFNTSLATPMGEQASQSQFLSNLTTRTNDQQTRLKETTNNLQSTDMAQAIVDLQQQQNLYQAGLQMTASLNKLSLADYLNL